MTSVSWLGYYDSWLVLGLLLLSFARSRKALYAACLLTPWVDERFVVAVPLALLCRYLDSGRAGRPVIEWKKDIAIPCALVAAFAFLRLVILSGATQTGATAEGYLAAQAPSQATFFRYVFGGWEGLRIGWLFVVAAIALLRPRPGFAALLGILAAVLLLVGLASAQDLSRSVMMLEPVAVLGVLLAAESAGTWVPGALRAGAALALLLPAYHVMTDRVNPVFYLYHELFALQNPPAAVTPEIYELRGILAMEQGDYSRAESDFGLSIKLARDPAGPSQQRGVLYASAGRWTEAQQDFARIVQFEPSNPDGWFLSAQAANALGRSEEAKGDLTKALALGSKTWAARPDVVRYCQRLGVTPHSP